jgi:ribosomal RNA-processing protein 9
MAGDSFFAKDKKRKRLSTGGSARTPYEKPYRPAMYGKGADGSKAGRRRKDEELTDEGEDDGNGVDLDDMNFRRDDLGDSGAVYDSDGEEADKYESAAAKRVRLAKGYLEKVKGDLAGGLYYRNGCIHSH